MLDINREEMPPGALPKSDKLLFKGNWLEIRRRDVPEIGIEDYEYTHESKLKGMATAVLPYRSGIGISPEWSDVGTRQFLLRKEITPAWGLEEKRSAITGMGETNEDVIWTAMRELSEESGYHVDEEELIILGTSRLGKSCDTVVYLFSADLSDAAENAAVGDGTALEDSARCDWEDRDDLLQSPCPLVHVMYNRLQVVLSDHSDMKIREEWFESPQQRQAIK